MSGIKRVVETAQSALKAELKGGADIPLATKVKLWRRGFKSVSHQLFDLEHNDPRDYVSDLNVGKARQINGEFGRILKDKLLFAPMFSPYAQVPEILGVVERGQVYPLSDPELRSVDALVTRAGAGMIFKPAQGNKGKGVFSVSQGGEDGLRLNGAPATPTEVAQKVAALDGYLIVARVQQAPYAQTIFPGSANTLRVVTMQDPDTGEIFIPAAIHRFGTEATVPTDNFQTGGVSVAVNLDTGTLERAVQFPAYTGGKLRWLSAHPDTHAPITGVGVPRWDEVKATVTRLIEAFRFLKYVGWDVVVTDDDVVIIEGNHNINLGLQVHGPLLKNPRVRRFYEHHKIIEPR